jgi:hypothetical protein
MGNHVTKEQQIPRRTPKTLKRVNRLYLSHNEYKNKSYYTYRDLIEPLIFNAFNKGLQEIELPELNYTPVYSALYDIKCVLNLKGGDIIWLPRTRYYDRSVYTTVRIYFVYKYKKNYI